MTDTLSRLAELADHATPGPWTAASGYADSDWTVTRQGSDQIIVEFSLKADAAFIAACRDGVPALVAELKRLQDRIVQLEGYLEQREEWRKGA